MFRNLLLIITFFFPTLTQAIEHYPLHSHNDYERKEILWDAFNNKFSSLEADIWLWKGQLRVSHLPWNFKGTLEDLYLKPLQNTVDGLGPVPWPATSLILWIDIKSFRPSVRKVLARTLRKYPMIGKEVKVILTGHSWQKKNFIEEYPLIPVEYDESKYSDKTLKRKDFSWYGLNWKKHFKWKGSGKMPMNEYRKLRKMIKVIHLNGKRVRFYKNPDTLEAWDTMRRAEVDLINSDHPKKISDYWKEIAGPIFNPLAMRPAPLKPMLLRPELLVEPDTKKLSPFAGVLPSLLDL